MPRYEVETKLSPEQVMERATRYFGGELGLEMTQDSDCCLSFRGGGGHVVVTAEGKTDGGKTAVDLETREWDYQVREFMHQVA